MAGKTVGALIGFGLGWAMIQFGFLAAVFIGVCALAGFFIGRIVDGEVSLVELLDRYAGRERM